MKFQKMRVSRFVKTFALFMCLVMIGFSVDVYATEEQDIIDYLEENTDISVSTNYLEDYGLDFNFTDEGETYGAFAKVTESQKEPVMQMLVGDLIEEAQTNEDMTLLDNENFDTEFGQVIRLKAYDSYYEEYACAYAAIIDEYIVVAIGYNEDQTENINNTATHYNKIVKAISLSTETPYVEAEDINEIIENEGDIEGIIDLDGYTDSPTNEEDKENDQEGSEQVEVEVVDMDEVIKNLEANLGGLDVEEVDNDFGTKSYIIDTDIGSYEITIIGQNDSEDISDFKYEELMDELDSNKYEILNESNLEIDDIKTEDILVYRESDEHYFDYYLGVYSGAHIVAKGKGDNESYAVEHALTLYQNAMDEIRNNTSIEMEDKIEEDKKEKDEEKSNDKRISQEAGLIGQIFITMEDDIPFFPELINIDTEEDMRSINVGTVGSVGNIPGPENVTEAAIAVAAPGVVATGLSVIAGLGGNGTPPAPLGGGELPSDGTGNIPTDGNAPSGTNGIEEVVDLDDKKRSDIVAEESENQELEYDPEGYDQFGYDHEGYSRYGYNREGFDRNNVSATGKLESDYDANGYDAQGYDAYGYNEAGLNSAGFNMQGFNGDGLSYTGLPISAYENGVDSNGISAFGYNSKGEYTPNEAVKPEEISGETIIDAEGYDAEGYNAEGYNAEGYNAEGYNAEGYNAEGYNAEGYNAEGYNAEGYNAEGYDAEGFNAEGYNAEGFNAEGFNAEGYNAEGYNAEGYNAEGYNAEGYNAEGYNAEGYNAEGFNAEGYNAEGYNAEGFNAEGYNAEGYNAEGYNAEGYNAEGYNAEGYNAEGYNAEGYNAEGYNAEGYNAEGYNAEGYNAEGYNAEGYNAEGYNAEGYNAEGYNAEGYNAEGYNAEGFNAEGYNAEGYNAEGYNAEGFNAEGYNAEGYNTEGFNELGRDMEGFDKEGFDSQGYDRSGYSAGGYDTHGYNRDGFDRDGYDNLGFSKEGLDREGFNKEGFNAEGYNREGFNSAGYNAEGYDQDGFNREGIDSEGYDREGLNPEGLDRDGYDAEGYDKDGYNADGYDRNGKYRELVDSEGRPVYFTKKEFEIAHQEWEENLAYEEERLQSLKEQLEELEAQYGKDSYGTDGLFNVNSIDSGVADYSNGISLHPDTIPGNDGLDLSGALNTGATNPFDLKGGGVSADDEYDIYEQIENLRKDIKKSEEALAALKGKEPQFTDGTEEITMGNPKDSGYSAEEPFIEPEAEGAMIEPEAEESFIEPEAEGAMIEPEAEEPFIEPEAEGAMIEPEAEEPFIEPEAEGAMIEPEAEEPFIEPEAEGAMIEPEVEEPFIEPEAEGAMIEPEEDVPQELNPVDQKIDDKFIEVDEETMAEYGIYKQGDEFKRTIIDENGNEQTLTFDEEQMDWTYENSESLYGGDSVLDEVKRSKEDTETFIQKMRDENSKLSQLSNDVIINEKMNEHINDILGKMAEQAKKDGLTGEINGNGDVEKHIKNLIGYVDVQNKDEFDEKIRRIEQLSKIIKNRKFGITTEGQATSGHGFINELSEIKDALEIMGANSARELVTMKGVNGEALSWPKYIAALGGRIALAAGTLGASEPYVWAAEALYVAHDEIMKGNDEGALREALKTTMLNASLDYFGGKLINNAPAIGRVAGEAMPTFAKGAKSIVAEVGSQYQQLKRIADLFKLEAKLSTKQISKEAFEEGMDTLCKEQAEQMVREGVEKTIRDTTEAETIKHLKNVGEFNNLVNATKEELKNAIDESAKEAYEKGLFPTFNEAYEKVEKSLLNRTIKDSLEESVEDVSTTGIKSGIIDNTDVSAKGGIINNADTNAKEGLEQSIEGGGRESAEESLDTGVKANTETKPETNLEVKVEVKDPAKLETGNRDKINITREDEVVYNANCKKDTSDFIEKANNGTIDVEDCLDMKADTGKMRTLKNGNVDEVSDDVIQCGQDRFVQKMNKDIYGPTYRKVKLDYCEKHGLDPANVEIATVRTPGSDPNLVNTDNDIVMITHQADGSWKEVPTKDWADNYYKEFAENTNIMKNGQFDIQKAQEKFPTVDWEKMSDKECFETWGTKHGESPADIMSKDSGYIYSNQKHSLTGQKTLRSDELLIETKPYNGTEAQIKYESYNDKGKFEWSEWKDLSEAEKQKFWKLSEGVFDVDAAIKQYPKVNWESMTEAQKIAKWDSLNLDMTHIANGQRQLIDAEQIGIMEYNKVMKLWNEGSMADKKEAVEQLAKMGNAIKKIDGGYGNFGANEMSAEMQEGINIINNSNSLLEDKAKELTELGYDGIEGFFDIMKMRIESYKIVNN